MAKKILLDVDPGIDDAVALCLALFDPEIDVVAVTAVAGNVSADQATRNVQAVIEQLDPPRWPRIGVAKQPEFGLPARTTHGHGGGWTGQFELRGFRTAAPASVRQADLRRSAPRRAR